jgi:hypothetical protein
MADQNVLATQITVGMMGSGLLQFLKSREWIPFVTKNSAVINHVVLGITSLAGAVGVHSAWDASAHSLTITGLNAAAIAAALWIWAKQWCIQFMVHRGVFGSVAAPAVPAAAVPNPLLGGQGVKP